MSKARFVLFLFVVGPLFAAAQAAPQRPADDFPSLNTPGETTPQAVSDLNAQLIWLLAAAPGAHDTPQETTARRAYQQAAFGNVTSSSQQTLNATLRDFRSRHDAFAAEYNALIPSISRDDVWREYRNFRVKVSDLVADTIHSINDSFPDRAAQLHSMIEECKRTINLTTYKSSADTNYAENPHTAATGFAIIEGAVSNAPAQAGGKQVASASAYATSVVVGMVPGCRGKVFPVVMAVAAGPIIGPKTLPWEYINFQYTTPVSVSQPGVGIMVNCEMPQPH